MSAPADPTADLDPLPFAPPERPGELGRLGGYAALRLLGAGGMGRVYEAQDVALRRPVALKLMRPDLAVKPDARERFLRKARAAAAVTHDHIVRIYQVGEANGVPFIAMERLAGQSLEDRMRAGPVSVAEAVRIGAEAAAGLAAAHAAGLVHRDIKPANLWLEGPAGRVKILDFGLARSGQDATLTGSGQVFGTPAYMAPEQAAGRPVDHRADLFSLGCVLYHLLTGRRPFDGPDVMAVLHQLANHMPPPAREINPDVPPAVSALVFRMMAKEPVVRPASMTEVFDCLSTGRDCEGGRPESRSGDVDPDREPESSSGRKQRLLGILLDAKRMHAWPPMASLRVRDRVTILLQGCGTLIGVPVVMIGSAHAAWMLFDAKIPQVVAGWIGGCAVLGGIVVALLVFSTRTMSLWNDRLAALTAALNAEFPVESTHWGGTFALRDKMVVDSLVVQVTKPGFVVSRAPSLSHAPTEDKLPRP